MNILSILGIIIYLLIVLDVIQTTLSLQGGGWLTSRFSHFFWKGFLNISGATLPQYFKLPIEFSFGYHWQVSLDDLLFESMGEDLGIDDGGFTYSVGLKW